MRAVAAAQRLTGPGPGCESPQPGSPNSGDSPLIVDGARGDTPPCDEDDYVDITVARAQEPQRRQPAAGAAPAPRGGLFSGVAVGVPSWMQNVGTALSDLTREIIASPQDDSAQPGEPAVGGCSEQTRRRDPTAGCQDTSPAGAERPRHTGLSRERPAPAGGRQTLKADPPVPPRGAEQPPAHCGGPQPRGGQAGAEGGAADPPEEAEQGQGAPAPPRAPSPAEGGQPMDVCSDPPPPPPAAALDSLATDNYGGGPDDQIAQLARGFGAFATRACRSTWGAVVDTVKDIEQEFMGDVEPQREGEAEGEHPRVEARQGSPNPLADGPPRPQQPRSGRGRKQGQGEAQCHDAGSAFQYEWRHCGGEAAMATAECAARRSQPVHAPPALSADELWEMRALEEEITEELSAANQDACRDSDAARRDPDAEGGGEWPLPDCVPLRAAAEDAVARVGAAAERAERRAGGGRKQQVGGSVAVAAVSCAAAAGLARVAAAAVRDAGQCADALACPTPLHAAAASCGVASPPDASPAACGAAGVVICAKALRVRRDLHRRAVAAAAARAVARCRELHRVLLLAAVSEGPPSEGPEEDEAGRGAGEAAAQAAADVELCRARALALIDKAFAHSVPPLRRRLLGGGEHHRDL